MTNKDTLKESEYRDMHMYAIDILQKNVDGMLMIKDIVPTLEKLIEQTRKERDEEIVEMIEKDTENSTSLVISTAKGNGSIDVIEKSFIINKIKSND